MDKVRIKKFMAHQSAKVLALIWFVATASIFVPYGLFNLFTGAPKQQSLILISIPIIYLIFGYIINTIFFWVYNIVAGWVGGIEFDLEDVE